MTYRGHVENGVILLEDAPTLPEGAELEIRVVAEELAEPQDQTAPSLYERLRPVIGMAKGLPADASENVDHYLYGHPKK
jgi:hypothetical protein